MDLSMDWMDEMKTVMAGRAAPSAENKTQTQIRERLGDQIASSKCSATGRGVEGRTMSWCY